MTKSSYHVLRHGPLPTVKKVATFGVFSMSVVTLLSGTALAANECGVGADVTCGPAGNPYATGISYSNNVDQTVRVGTGVALTTPGSFGISLTGVGAHSVIFEGAAQLNVSGNFGSNAGGISSRNATRFDIDTRLGTINLTDGTSAINVGYTGSATDNRILTGTINVQGPTGGGAISVVSYNPGSGVLVDTRGGVITSDGFGISVNGSGAANVFSGDVTAKGDYFPALRVQGDYVLNVNTSAGKVVTTGFSSNAIVLDNSGRTKLTTGNINTEGQLSNAINVTSAGKFFFEGDTIIPAGDVIIDTSSGIITTAGDQSIGIQFEASPGTVLGSLEPVVGHVDAADLTLRSGAISTTGDLSSAIVVKGGGAVDIDTTAGAITTKGDGSGGVVIFGDRNVTQNITNSLSVTTGDIATSGNAAFGVGHYVYAGPLIDENNYSPPAFPNTPTVMNLNGGIKASGANSGGVVSLQAGVTAPITINANANITAAGQNSVGIAAGSFDGAVEINVAQDAVIEGGWSATLGDLSPGYSDPEINQTGFQGLYGSTGGVGGGLPAAGIVLWSGVEGISAVLNNKGTIGALSDLAIAQGVACGNSRGVSVARLAAAFDDNARVIPGGNGCTTNGVIAGSPEDIPVYDVAYPSTTGSVHIVNGGTINGFVTLWGGASHTLDNAGSFNIRNFSDTDGDGVRDIKRVSVSDFGGPDATFNNLNSGIVQLAAVQKAPVTDTTGSYVPTAGFDSRPLESSFYTIAREGVAQGQFVNLKTFNNAGTIDLRGEQVGNTLIITGKDTVDGSAGHGVFVSQGGKLLTNVVLNEGIAPGGATNSFADVLVVDGTELGSAATSVFVGNQGGSGALTPSNGIMLVEVRDKSRSENGVFALGDHGYTVDGRTGVSLGKYSYFLYHNGVNAGGVDDTADGNWYLRSELKPVDATNPVDPADPVDPVENPTSPIYEKIPSHLKHLITPSTMQQRVGNRYWNNPPAPTETVFCKDPSKNFKCEITTGQAQYYLDSKNNVVIEQNGLWGRVEGGYGRFKPSVSHTAQDSRDNWWKLQSGIDGLLYENEAGKFISGINVSYGQVRSRVDSWLGRPTNGGSTGELSTTGWGVGASLTWLGENGWYVDGQASATWFDMDLDSNALRMSLADGNNGMGYMASIEAGKRIALNEAWTLIPQAQFYWSHVDFDSFTDPLGLNVSMDRGDSFVGRYGLALEQQSTWKDQDDKTRRSSIYGIVNLYNEYLGETRVNWAGETLEQRDARFWGGVGLGGTYNWNDDRYSIYGELAAETSLEDIGDSYKLGGTLGLRVKW